MDTLIRFRLLASKLDKTEKQCFVLKIIEHHGIEFILDAVFNHFNQSIPHLKPHQIEQIASINHIISEIIQKRKKKNNDENTKESSDKMCRSKRLQNKKNENEKDDEPNKNTSNAPMIMMSPQKIDELPSTLISVIGSFLKMKSYFSFQRTNRTNYIGLHSPFSLKCVDSIVDNQYPINWKKFKYVQSFHIKIPHFIKSIEQFSNDHKFNNINTLIVDNDHNVTLDQFLNDEHINFSNVTSLYCKRFGQLINRFKSKTFLKFLSLFPNLEYLNVEDMFFNLYNYPLGAVSKLFPNLRGLAQNNTWTTQIGQQLMNSYQHQLISLECSSMFFIRCVIERGHSLSKLQRLRIRTPTKYVFSKMNQLNNLKEIFIDKINDAQKNGIEDNIVKLIVSRSKLEHVEICCNYTEYAAVFDGIERALLNTEQQNRRIFKISLHFDVQSEDKVVSGKLILSIKRIVKQMKDCNINHFMFVCKLNLNDNHEQISFNKENATIDYLKQNYLFNQFGCTQTETLSISNKDYYRQ